MPDFSFNGRKNGVSVSGTLTGSSQAAIVNELLNRGITPIRVTEIRPVRSVDLRGLLKKIPGLRPRVTIDDRMMFCRQMHALTRAGLPVSSAVKGLGESTHSERMREALASVGARLEAGSGLAPALRAEPEVFPDLVVSMVHMGEQTGRLEASFKHLAAYLQLERDTLRRVRKATRYPVMVLLAMAVALGVVNFLVIPQFAKVFDSFGAELPLPTQVLVSISGFFLQWWWLALMVMIAVIYLGRRYLETSGGRLRWDRFYLRIPVVGGTLEKIALSRFCHALSLMISAGLQITTALNIVGGVVGNRWVAGHLESIRDGIERGENLAVAASQAGIFPPLVMQMLKVGAETGQVDDMLAQVALFYDEEIDYELDRLSEAIEPLLISVMAGFVLILALGIFLPIWDLGSVAIG